MQQILKSIKTFYMDYIWNILYMEYINPAVAQKNSTVALPVWHSIP